MQSTWGESRTRCWSGGIIWSKRPVCSLVSFFLLLFYRDLGISYMFSIRRTQIESMKKSEYPLNLKCGIRQHETFAVKSMDVNSNLLKLKLDMVYREIPMEEAQKRFEDITATVPPVSEPPPPPKPKVKPVKVRIPKSK